MSWIGGIGLLLLILSGIFLQEAHGLKCWGGQLQEKFGREGTERATLGEEECRDNYVLCIAAQDTNRAADPQDPEKIYMKFGCTTATDPNGNKLKVGCYCAHQTENKACKRVGPYICDTDKCNSPANFRKACAKGQPELEPPPRPTKKPGDGDDPDSTGTLGPSGLLVTLAAAFILGWMINLKCK